MGKHSKALYVFSKGFIFIAVTVFLLVVVTSENSHGLTFSLTKTVNVDYGGVWCIPVFDGNSIVVSTEQNGTIKVGNFDTSLNQTSTAVTVATSADTANGDTIADHKHLFQNNYHYITFSTSGSGQGGYLYLLKLDANLQRSGITTVVSDGSPTNDMFIVGDGTYIYVGQLYPGNGHKVYKYDSSLALKGTYVIGTGTNVHANGAAAVYSNGYFHLVAPDTLAPGANDNFSRIIYDSNWNVVAGKSTILTDKGMLSIVSALSIEPTTGYFIIHYGRGSSDKGGDLYRAVYNKSWGLISNTLVVSGTWTRPHSMIYNNKLYVGYDTPPNLSSFSITNTAKSDFNADGYPDILLRNKTSGANYVWLMSGTTISSTQSLASLSDATWKIVGTGDFNKDGSTDILWRNTSTGDIALWYMNGTSASSSASIASVSDANWEIAAVADFNQDDYPDILWRNKTYGYTAVWLLNNTTISGIASLPTISGTSWVIGGTGDFNADGYQDIIWRYSSTGANAVWLMNGTSVSSTATLPSLTGSTWEIAGAADFDKDGNYDILWRDKSTGANVVWLMNGTSVSSSVSLQSISDTIWDIAGLK
ncbi:FG-GAP repeat domain-containing protein [Candidatus Magnetominusculus xianensis]|uniref:FG-GAP repeat-containing protein n=1 Tax=Candidatus Magnetominusculus xianensis TaxID=1748249 RepID=A0ABR5SGZ2_9BACT|nr:VCBS repeat-containing protein [Candidatus Magnetominusculus xianensis]KWT85085.1 FG-GAP repeat-containing protein [Candidatus Magnetominusculus xianensis]MBF0402454.1 VCBS repeat-containing protein [Nitrospirota bacterium]